MAALSLGTATVSLPGPIANEPASAFLQQRSKTGLKNDLEKLATSILDDPPDIATFLAHVMTGSGRGLAGDGVKSRIVRLNPLISPVEQNGSFTGPGGMTESAFNSLANLDFDAVEQDEVNAISQYADLWLADVALNQPIRMNGTTRTPELGQDKFSAAKAAWLAIQGE